MKIVNIAEELSSNSYPGRGIVLGKTPDGKKAVIAYFIMGRSENSRNRIFEENDRGGIRTKAFDESKMVDPSLIIYNPVLKLDGKTIVTNGDQTDTIYDFMKEGKCYRHALLTREFEPDEPNYTPRISGVVKPDGDYVLSILKSNMGKPQCLRFSLNILLKQVLVILFIHISAMVIRSRHLKESLLLLQLKQMISRNGQKLSGIILMKIIRFPFLLALSILKQAKKKQESLIRMYKVYNLSKGILPLLKMLF